MTQDEMQMAVQQPLKNKVALVIGASRGIGRAIAERLGHDGAHVVITYINSSEQAEKVVETIRSYGSQAQALKSDARKPDEIHQLFAQVLERFGKLDILINNAASPRVFKPTAMVTLEEYDRMFDVTRGFYFALQEAAKHLADNGRIISISTGGTAMNLASTGVYTGSKAAIEQFSVCLAREVGSRGITVNIVAPGITETDGVALDQQQLERLIAQTALGRIGQPDDIASVVALLVSEDAHWITGQRLNATGGIV